MKNELFAQVVCEIGELIRLEKFVREIIEVGFVLKELFGQLGFAHAALAVNDDPLRF
ncbi:MAG: hypothetical protein AAB354_04640 [candidate division KSB1 bacterium]